MIRLVLLNFIAVLLVACAASPSGQPAITLSASTTTPISRMASPTSTQPPTTLSTPTSLPASPPPSPSPTPAATSIFDLYIDNLAITPDGRLYANGFQQGSDLRHFAQWGADGWSELGNGFNTAGNSLAVDNLGNIYTEILTDTVNCMAIMEWDGMAWKDITGNFSQAVDALQMGRVSCNIPVVALTVGAGNTLYAAGSYSYAVAGNTAELPMGYVAAWDQLSWRVLGQGFEGVYIYALAAGPAGNLYISGEQPSIDVGKLPTSGFIAQWDGKNWSQIETDKPETCTSVLRLASDGAEGVYAVCTQDGPGVLISHWDGTAWITLTDRLEGEAPVVFAMAADKVGGLYIGGDFEAVSGVPVRDIAYWDGQLWHDLAGGMNERVQALAFNPENVLTAAGWFSQAGGVPVDHIAVWDGASWRALAP